MEWNITPSLVILLIYLTTDVFGRNQLCYICIPNIGDAVGEVIKMYPSGPPVPLCSRFVEGTKEYIRECPSKNYKGCMTQTNGTHVTKTCSEFPIQDCKTANNIKYCYCIGDLCNKESVPLEAPRPPIMETDDEDSTEGSGSSRDTLIEEAPTTQSTLPLTPVSPASACAKAHFYISLAILAVIFNFYLI